MPSRQPPVGEFSQDGSVVRLKFLNFMQYADTEFTLGPNLNVIIGPNGSGKSTIVNGICLGLAGKTSFLGRANNVADFIKLGEDTAYVEVELYQEEEGNIIIGRKWDKSSKSSWTVNEKKAGQKEVEKIVSDLRIQVGNLCQFLPQDKVHDFSRLNNQGLLDSTVDAVGEVDLKEKHNELKDLQKELNEGEDLFERKKQMLRDATKKCERLEEDVKAFNEKKKIENVIELLEKKRKWAQYTEVKKDCKQKKVTFEEAQTKWHNEEIKMKPLHKALNDAKKKKDDLEGRLRNDNNRVRENMGRAKQHSQKIEKIEEAVDKVEEALDDIDRKEQARQAEIKRLEIQIAELEAEQNATEDDTSLGPQLTQAKSEAQILQRNVNEEKMALDNTKYEQLNVGRQIKDNERQLSDLKDIDRQKLEVLKGKCKDSYEAVRWLRQNKDKFQHEVYEPLIVCGNVDNPDNAQYLENRIQLRDMTSFFFQSADEMNMFLNEMRQARGWKRVSAVQVNDVPMSQYVPRQPRQQLQEMGLVGYLAEMITGPEKVMSFMCKQYGIHNVPVFKPQSEKFNDKIIQLGFTRFYFGKKSQAISGSKYSSHKTTMTTEIRPQNSLQVSLDTERSNTLELQLREFQERHQQLEEKVLQQDQQYQEKRQTLETVLQKAKELEQRKNFKQRQMAKIDMEKTKLRKAMSAPGTERERRGIQENRKKLVRDMITANINLQASIKDCSQAQLTMDTNRLVATPLQDVIEQKQAAVAAAIESVGELKHSLDICQQEFSEAKSAMAAAFKEAKASTGSGVEKDKPPENIQMAWKKEELPDRLDDIDGLIVNKRAELDCMDDVDPQKVADYRRIKDQIQELENDIERRDANMAERNARVEQVKAEWLEKLAALVERINTRFSEYFASMGFAGEVGLDCGNHENDFENYGIKIKVKYREQEPLQELSGHHQSGGERSVATALYMLALQELTTVPFRCVDEINQGMDARNERRVFELLVRTSCRESSAQYFLLTPKLLPGLDYEERMNVLVVNNGPQMCHHSEWDMDEFHQIAERDN